MAIDIVARGLATQLIDENGKVAADKMPVFEGTSTLEGFTSIGKLTDPTLVEGKTAEEILLMMLYGVVNPTFIDPSLSIALNDENEVLIIGRESTLNGTLSFDQGSIEPAYGTSGKRAGAPISYVVGDQVISTTNSTVDFSITINPTERKNYINYSVAYEAGEQPKNSIGQNFDKPFPSGILSDTLLINAINAIYSKEAKELNFNWFEDEDGEGYQVSLPTETMLEKQSFMVSTDVNVIGIKAYSALTQSWEWLGGETAAYSLTCFDTTLITGDSIGEAADYVLYTHNQARTGARELRIYIQ